MNSAFLALVLAASNIPDEATLKKMNAKFVPVELTADVKALPDNERAALAKLVRAARVFDALFLRQTWAGDESMLLELLRDPSALGKERLHAFLINKGPWDRLEHYAPFVPGAPAKPEAADFYPAGATKAEVEAWIKSLPEAQRERAAGFFTVLRRGADQKLEVIPYSVEYQGELAEVAALLRDAAGLTQQPTLKAFLSKRADAFLSNDYYDSDLAWMALDASVEPTIGPYEVYEDEWFNYKAAFEAFITLRDDAETKKLERFGKELQDLEDHLPIDPAMRNPKIGALAPIRVVNEIFASGDANHGVQTAAFNLPNDERIEKEKGTKRVMLKNVQEAKFKAILLPIAKVTLSAADQKTVAFDSFFTHILMHELMHGLGPHTVNAGGRASTVRQELQETYSAIEEAKADISGLWALQYLIDKGVLDKAMERTLYTTYVASSFRTLRFGLVEAHGKGMAIQLNTFLDSGAVRVAPDGTFGVEPKLIKDTTAKLTRDLLTIEGHGDRAAAKKLIETMAVVRPEVQRALDKLSKVPVDIEPRFSTAEVLLKQFP